MVYEANQNEGMVGGERKEGQRSREQDWPSYTGQIREKLGSRKGRVVKYWSVPYCGHVRREGEQTLENTSACSPIFVCFRDCYPALASR